MSIIIGQSSANSCTPNLCDLSLIQGIYPRIAGKIPNRNHFPPTECEPSRGAVQYTVAFLPHSRCLLGRYLVYISVQKPYGEPQQRLTSKKLTTSSEDRLQMDQVYQMTADTRIYQKWWSKIAYNYPTRSNPWFNDPNKIRVVACQHL